MSESVALCGGLKSTEMVCLQGLLVDAALACETVATLAHVLCTPCNLGISLRCRWKPGKHLSSLQVHAGLF